MEMALNVRRNKKGFTLVEVIVVLVILAILAAILVPSMVGWIDKAQKKTAVVEGRTILVAAQTIVSENYPMADGAMAEPQVKEVTDLAQLDGISDVEITVTGNKVTAFTFTSSESFTVTYDGSTITAE
ncbi:prepilin-type N-terminal cleavage/methylation domain-containing protein [Gehongia tenuis]|uniref:Prepilin-type N-terminal cleavage/methylation domain-containing protein n=1 Tax=Gehongia tenuis TaxID=2763655 RepID=A0A926D492_9FIRM|nr:prepilin-type N-terminal cleavage/methylation domain-containing protein [Gehongia tenuis]MBC8531057.1 prepilin-type N-terminal cleavage/methylation domain-containing protein [Gehongia tenuis]